MEDDQQVCRGELASYRVTNCSQQGEGGKVIFQNGIFQNAGRCTATDGCLNFANHLNHAIATLIFHFNDSTIIIVRIFC